MAQFFIASCPQLRREHTSSSLGISGKTSWRRWYLNCFMKEKSKWTRLMWRRAGERECTKMRTVFLSKRPSPLLLVNLIKIGINCFTLTEKHIRSFHAVGTHLRVCNCEIWAHIFFWFLVTGRVHCPNACFAWKTGVMNTLTMFCCWRYVSIYHCHMS